MPNPQIYTTELERFRKKYNMPEYNLDAVMAINQKFQYVNNFLNNDTVENNAASQFRNAMARTLSMYFEANTKLRADGKYMSGFYPKKFLSDFEELASAKYHSELNEGEQPQRKKFDGAKMRDLKKSLINNFKDLNKTLPTLWAEKLKNGSMTQNELLLATGNVMDALDSAMPESKIGLEDKVTNVVAAHEALKQLRASRSGFLGWLWKIIFRERNEIEKTNLNTLESQVNRLRTEGYPVDKIAEELTSKTVLGVELSTEKKAESDARKEEKDLREKNSVAEKVTAIRSEPQFKETFVNDMLDALPNAETDRGLKKALLMSTLEGSFLNVIQQHNKDFSAASGDATEYVISGAKEILKKAYVLASGLGYKNPVERLVAAQTMMDQVMKKLSPAAFDAEKYGEFANGYALKNPDFCKEVLGEKLEVSNMFDENAEAKLFEDATKAYNDLQREQINIAEANLQANADVAPHVDNAPVLEASVVDKN